MIIIATADSRLGMFFNNRRISRDRVVTEKIREIVGNNKLWVDPYSLDLFPDACAAEDFLNMAGESDFCFVENRSLREYENKINKVYLFLWNRKYPSDIKFDLPMGLFELQKITQIQGFLHDAVSLLIYEKNEEES